MGAVAGLSVSRLIRVSMTLSPTGAAFANLNSVLFLGDSPVINVVERIRSYGSIEDVGADFSGTDPEYLAALLFFAQNPQPTQLFIGRWASSATSGFNIGGPLTAAQQAIGLWTAITNGSFDISIDGAVHKILSLNFSAQTNLNGVAAVISANLPDTAASAAVQAPGGSSTHNYVPADTITLAGGTSSVAAILTVVSTQVVSATVVAGGTGGTNGVQTVTGTTGTGTKFQALVTIAGGIVTAVNSISVAGAYTANPAVLTAEPVTGASLTGCTLNVKMGVLTASVSTAGTYTVLPANPVAQASSSGAGTGATFNMTWDGLGGAVCTWTGSQFVITSNTTGVNSAVGYATTDGSGTDISAQLGLTAATGSSIIGGIAAETFAHAISVLDAGTTYWYGLLPATPTVVDADLIAAAAYIQAASKPHLFGFTTNEASALVANLSTDIGSVLKAAGYTRTFAQWSNTAYAAASMFGRILTTNLQANNTMITLAYKNEPGITPDGLTDANANVLDTKRYNYFAQFQNNTAIIVNGWCCATNFIDEIFGADAFANDLQTTAWNALYTTPTKVPQTDAGNQIIANALAGSCNRYVNNGFIAPGTWNSAGFGQLVTGQYLPKGWYIFTPPIASQPENIRGQRISVPFQIAAKLAGAIQSVDISVVIER